MSALRLVMLVSMHIGKFFPAFLTYLTVLAFLTFFGANDATENVLEHGAKGVNLTVGKFNNVWA